MSYNKTTWQDRAVQYPNRFTQATNADGTITLTPSPGTISQAGTPITASALNNLETQYDNAYTDAKSYVASYASPLFSQAVYTGAKGNFSGNNIQMCGLLFFTNGGSATATANFTFGTAFKSNPYILPANITQVQDWGDTLVYPYIYNVTTTGFSAKIGTSSGHVLGTSTPANLIMYFMAFGQV